MRKIFTIVLLVTSVSLLYGCKSNNVKQNNNTPTTPLTTVSPTATVNPTTSEINSSGNGTANTGYKDGVYDIKHKSTKPGYEEAVVTIKNGKIEGIDLKRLDDNQVEVNYDQWNGTGEYPNLKQYRIDLAKAMLAKQSPDVDAISGATQSSNGWKAAVSDALNQAKQ